MIHRFAVEFQPLKKKKEEKRANKKQSSGANISDFIGSLGVDSPEIDHSAPTSRNSWGPPDNHSGSSLAEELLMWDDTQTKLLTGRRRESPLKEPLKLLATDLQLNIKETSPVSFTYRSPTNYVLKLQEGKYCLHADAVKRVALGTATSPA